MHDTAQSRAKVAAASTGRSADAVAIAAQRRRAKRGAVLLGLLAFATYIGFIVATGWR